MSENNLKKRERMSGQDTASDVGVLPTSTMAEDFAKLTRPGDLDITQTSELGVSQYDLSQLMWEIQVMSFEYYQAARHQKSVSACKECDEERPCPPHLRSMTALSNATQALFRLRWLLLWATHDEYKVKVGGYIDNGLAFTKKVTYEHGNRRDITAYWENVRSGVVSLHLAATYLEGSI